MTEFLALGGYAWFVWMAYGAAVVVIVGEIAMVRARRKRAFQRLRMAADARPHVVSAEGVR
jgi:heme exporter protein D